MLKTLLRLWSKLSLRRRNQFFLLGVLMLVGGFAEVVSLGALVPFLAVLAAPEKVLSYPLGASFLAHLQNIASAHGLLSSGKFEPPHLITIFAVFFVLTALGASTIRLLLLYMSVRLANAAGADISLEVYRRTLYQPYLVHVSQNSSAIISNITSKVWAVVSVLSNCLTLGTSFFVISAIILCLYTIHPVAALISACSLGSCYALITSVSKKRLAQNSFRISRETDQVVKALQEGLGGIRDVLLDGTQPIYCKIYQQADAPLRIASASNTFISQSPRFTMEATAMVLFAALVLWMASGPQGLLTALPVLGALALGAQRLLPALQQGYAAWSGILGSRVVTEDVLKFLDQPISSEAFCPPPMPLDFKKSLCFEAVSFRYNSKSPWVFERLSFTVFRGTRVGFVGKTGSGKSTCLDLLMGLLEPTEGQILIDGVPLTHTNLRAWQTNVVHVPQAIYLSDNTLAENIAFGVPASKIDMNRVKEAARQAQIAEFIESSRMGYQALVGERGIRLSGGQRQRIGIARALYKQAQVLVFDEATSALDHETEDAVMQSINSLSTELTILIIAHRTSTLKNCDELIDLDFLKKSGGQVDHLLAYQTQTDLKKVKV